MKRAMRRRKTWQRQAAAITAAMMAMSVGGIAYAMPQGEVIRSGKGEITRQDKDMTVNQDSKRLAIDWSGFDIANDERVTFRQPDKDSVALNRVVGDAASVIDGTLSGNGHVYVINPNGVLFGKNASVDVGSLVASTARISDSDMTNFANADGITMAIPEDSSAKVINAGTIRAEGGLVVLHAAEVENSGTITNPEGTTALAAARNLSLSADTAGKINFTVDGALAKAKALNSGMLKADGGYLVMTARSAGDVMSTVVNNTGTMEAKTLRQNEKGEILLDGDDNGIVELNGTLDVSGMEAGQSAGSIKAIGAETHVEDGATLHAIGAVDGGLIETSGDYLEIGDNVDIDAAGKTGKAGEWLLDPLEVVISDSSSRPTDSEAVESDKKDEGNYSSSNNASGTASRNKTTWVNSDTVNTLLNKGTAVSVQATDANKVASITLNSAINKTSGADTSLTLEAQRNVTVNAGIKSTSGALDVNLHSDTDGDGLGAVLINADIATNGGTFTSGSGTTIESGSVGTYFGNQGEMGDRHVTTNGGAINLYGDVAIGLNGGTLTLDTKNKTTGASGAVKVTGTVDSGNSYKRVASGLEGWTDFVKSYYDEVMSDEDKYTAPTYTLRRGAEQYPASEYYPKYVLNSDGTVSQITSGSGYRWRDLQATGNTVTLSSYDELSASQKDALSSNLATLSKTWAGAKAMAQGATKGTNNTGDTYLATITTALENSLASPPEEYQLIVGGQGSGDATRLNPHPADPSHPDGYYWVTGPEGMANNGKGTKFAYNDGSAVDNYYVKWNYSYSQDTKKKEKEPNNSGPIVSIGFGTESKWDDVLETAGTIRGFVQEKNLEHSGLVINAGDSKVDIAGNIGNSVALKNVEINAGDVAIGSGEHYTGIVHSDEGVSITGKNVTVGDRITADTKGVDIQATGNINVDGITAHENINLTTTGESSAIVLNHTHNDGALITKSTDNDAVIIDARGTDGSFKNLTTAEKAITTGEGGNWKVYSYSPDADTFGTNLYSGTNAQWGATSDTYLATNDENKYIFQVQPTVYVTANDMTKVYGEELTNANVTTTAEATFIGQDNKEHNVNEYTDAFNEGDVADYYNGSGTFTSEGWAKTATRTGGDKAPASEPENNAIYNIKATTPESYNLTAKGAASGYADATTKDGGTVEVLRRQINVNGSGSQTYGNATINDWKLTASLTGNQEGVPSDADAIVNDDKLDESTGNLSIKSGSSYAENQAGRTTADANPDPYEDAVNMENVGFENGAGVNYEIVKAQGDLKVNKANLTITTNGFEKVYGDVEGVQNALKNAVTVTGLTNGDNNGESMITVDGTSEALIDVDGEIRTNNVKDGGYDIDAVLATDLQNTIHTNYNVTPGTGKAVLTKKGITLITDDIKTTYGDGNTIRDKVNNDLLHLEGLVSWDKESDVFAEITPGVSVDTTNKSQSPYKIVDGKPATDEKGNLYTNDVRDDKGYSITTHYHNVANNYNVTSTEGHVKVTKAKLQVKVGDVSTTYGTAFDTSKYTYSYADGIVNGDTAESLNASLSSKLGLLPGQYVNTAARDGEDGVWTADAGDEYTISLKSTKGRNFFDYYLKNYDTEVLAGKATVEKANLVVNVGNAETVYGTKFDEKKYSYDYSTEAGETLVNGDTKRSLATELGKIKYYNEAALDGTDDKWTAAVGDTYKLMFTNGTKATFNALNNYNVSFVDGKAKVTPASLTIQIDDASTVYGTKFDEKKYGYNYAAGITNGDTEETLNAALGGMNYTNDAALDGTDGKWTRDVGNYDLTGEGANSLTNYKVTYLKGTATVTPYTITEDDIIAANPHFTTVYGNTTTPVEVKIKGVNGDEEISNTATTTAYIYDETGNPVKTENVGDREYDIESTLTNGNYQFEGGKTSKVFANTASVTPADLTVQIGDASTVYGTKFDESKYGYSYVSGITNGDTEATLDAALGGMDYTNGAALDGTDGKWTRDVGNYDLTGEGANSLTNYKVTYLKGTATVTPYTITEDGIIAANPHFTTVYGDTTTPVEVKIKGVNGDEEISNTATTTAYIYNENGNPIKTEHVGDTYDIESTLTNSNYQFEGGKTSKVFDNTASVTKADLTVNVGNAETVYGTPFDTSKYDYAYSTETGKSLVNGDTKESLLKDLGTIGYDNEAALDGTDGKWTAAVGDGYKLAFTDATAAAFKALNDYDVKVVDGKAKVTPYTITEDDIIAANPHFTTVYGDTTTPVEVAIKGVNGDATVGNTATTSAYEYGTDGTPVKTKDVGDKIYDITSVLTNKNYRFEDGSDTKLFANTASVTPADLTIQIGNASTIYGTKFDESQYGYNYASGITNGDTEVTLDAALGGMNYTNDAALDGTNGKWTKDVGDYALKGEGVNGLKNYKVTYLDGTATVTPLNITEDNVNDFITNATYTTVYGSKADFGQAVFTGVNGDGTRDLSITGSSALTGNTEGVITKDAAENAYNTVVSLDGLSEQDKKNYGLEDTRSFTFDNSATVEKADLTVSRKGIETVYGTVKKDPGDMTTYTTLVNGDTNDIVIDNGNYGTAYNDELTKTNNVGKYDYKATLNSASDVLRNYNVIDKGTNYVNITPYTITDQEVVNLDGSPLYTTKYGQKDAFGTATFTGVNGDGTYELAITDSSALATAGAGKVTKDVGKNIYDTTVELSEAMNGNYQFADGATSKTFEKTASVTPAELTIKTKDVETEYGTVKTTTSEVEGLVNGDLPTGFIYDYGNYGGAYLDGNTKTNDVNTYHFGTTLSGAEFLKNYTITGGEADVKIDPKDITFFVSGTGNTLDDITYTVDPDIDAQLAYGEHVDEDYTPGNDLGSNQYGVVAHINGTPIVTGDVAGNYRYNYGGLITLSSTVPTKPDIDPHNPSNLDGSGSWTSNMGNHGVPGVERVAGLASAELPFFKVDAGQVSHYGTYDVAADPDKVRLEPTGKRLPEPNQPKTQYREYTKALTTTDGTGMFRMVYDGSTFNITPVDDGALALMRIGDVKNNVELSAEALHAGFSEMGILLEDLDGVYVHFDTMA